MKNQLKLTIAFQSLALLLGALCLLVSCDIQENNDAEPETLVRIFDNDRFNQGFIPIDVKQTSDGGYLILGGSRVDSSDFMGVYVLRADAEGNFVSDRLLPQSFVNPLYNLIQVGQEYYFFCMNNSNLNTRLMRIDEAGQVNEVSELPFSYPLYASPDQGANGFILLQYDRDALETVVHRIDLTGNATSSQGFEIGVGDFNVEIPIFNHLTRRGRQLPFLTGFTDNGTYFFNGFYNYTLSLVFFNFGSNEDVEPGVVQGFRDERAISALVHLSGTSFALSRYSFGSNFILPQVSLDPAGISSSKDLLGNPFPELVPDARILLKRVDVNGQPILLYASETRAKQIILLAYDAATGALLNTRRLGFSNPYEIGSFSATQDGGLVVVGTTFVAGRFPRICLFKLSPEDLQDLVAQ
ncbi:MAG: hypothetical protein HC880_19455 [Bacteroidia bacterium]|nr:hypothetical protein [Bacteroidia bacterium]